MLTIDVSRLGIAISDEAIEQLKAHVVITDDDLEIARKEEAKRRHDVMGHVQYVYLLLKRGKRIYGYRDGVFDAETDPRFSAYGQVAPAAAGIIHLGATSCYVTDNADLIFLRDGLDLLLPKLATVIHRFSRFALQYKDMPTLGYT